MKKTITTLMLLLTVAFLSFGQDIRPIGVTNLQGPSWSVYLPDGSLYIYKSSTLGYTKILSADLVQAKIDSLAARKIDLDGMNSDINYLNFKANISNPTHQEGRLFYDSLKHATSYYNDEADITVNIAREFLIRVYNNTAVPITNGMVVYPNGDFGGVPTVGLADAAYYDRCRIIAVVTHTIEPFSYGYATKFGDVGSLDTSGHIAGELFYLGHNGVMTDEFPSHDDFVCIIGAVGKVHATEGSVVVDTKVSDYAVDVNLVRGWDSYIQGNEVTVSFVNLTRTVSVTPTDPTFHIYEDGMKYVLDGTKSLQISDVEGKHYIYFNKDQISELVNPSSDQLGGMFRTNTSVCFVYWDAANDQQIMLGNERHTINMQGATQGYLHQTQWTRCIPTGFIPLNLVTDNGSLDIYAQFGVDAGIIIDEDIQSSTPSIASAVGLPIYYRTGSGSWRRAVRAGFSILTDGTTGLTQYNKLTAGVWSLASNTNNYHGFIHVYGTNDLGSNKIVALMGTGDYASKLDADLGLKAEVLSIKSQFPFAEGKHLYSILYSTKTSYANTPKMNIELNYQGGLFYDFRDVTEVPSTGASATTASFLSLNDTPPSYAGQTNKLVGVTSGELGVEFKAVTATSAGTVNIPTGQQYQINGGSIIVDAINDGVTTTTSSQNAVFDALALKAPTIGSSNYIQNQISLAQNANMWIRGMSVINANSGTYIPLMAFGNLNIGNLWYGSFLVGNAQSSNQSAQFGWVYDQGTPNNSFAHITPYGTAEGSAFKLYQDGRAMFASFINTTGYKLNNIDLFGSLGANTIMKWDGTKSISIPDGTNGQFLGADGSGGYGFSTLPIASATVTGTVKVDGTTIIATNGVLSSSTAGTGWNHGVQSFSGTTITYNVSNGINANLTLSGNTTINMSNVQAGMVGSMTILNDGTVRSLTFTGYTFNISLKIRNTTNSAFSSGLSQVDSFTWSFDGTRIIITGEYNVQ